MHELWSLLNFLYPEVLSNSDVFDKDFKRPAPEEPASTPDQIEPDTPGEDSEAPVKEVKPSTLNPQPKPRP